jgi:hypothetical protein
MASFGVEQPQICVCEFALRQTAPVSRSRTTMPATPGRLAA